MAEPIPQAVLSEHFQDRMKGRRLISAVFTTFCFEPAFFETEILPVFLDLPLSHAERIRLMQLEEALKCVPGTIAVYYDHNGLVAGGGCAKLDVRRIPVRHQTGVFHPKNVLLLVEALDADADGKKPRALLFACMSANLTRAGWWSNVEVAHVEEIAEGDRTLLAAPLQRYLNRLVRLVEGQRANDELRDRHPAIRDIVAFLDRSTDGRTHRSVDGRLLPHFDDGTTSLQQFLWDATSGSLREMCLEIISPYFDGEQSLPLQGLVETFEPEETRIYLPRGDSGEGLCSEALFKWVDKQPGVTWGCLPKNLLKQGGTEDAKARCVHAKVYRFFEPKRGGRELLYVGSTNLTRAGCGTTTARRANWECGFLIEVTSRATPDWWLQPDSRKPSTFAPEEDVEGAGAVPGTNLVVRYDWRRHVCEVYWSGTITSPPLTLEQGGVVLFEVPPLEPRAWTALGAEAADALKQVLLSTSLLHVRGEHSEPGLLLVQEEGMSHSPSLLEQLSTAEILKYWSQLTQEQRAAFIDAHARNGSDDDPLLAALPPLKREETFFDRFAGFFLAFDCLEQRVAGALSESRWNEADSRLFGRKYDSLSCLLERLLADIRAGSGDPVEQYVVLLCAKQLVRELTRRHPEYFRQRRAEVTEVEEGLAATEVVRQALSTREPDMPPFLDWFDRWFLARAARATEVVP